MKVAVSPFQYLTVWNDVYTSALGLLFSSLQYESNGISDLIATGDNGELLVDIKYHSWYRQRKSRENPNSTRANFQNLERKGQKSF